MSSSEAKKIKKEEIEDDEDDDKPIGLRNRNIQIPKNNKLKKEEHYSDDDDHKPLISKTTTKPNKVPVKKNVKEEVTKEKGGIEAKVTTVKKERKVYDLPGQKRDPPEERDSLRIFYESLYEQVPTSDMAAIWMMESGLLPRDKAAEVLQRKLKNAKQQKGSPMKSVVTVRKVDTVTVKRKTTVTTSTPVSKLKKETPQSKKARPTKAASQQSNKRKIQESTSEEEYSESDSDHEVIAAPKNRKKQRVD